MVMPAVAAMPAPVMPVASVPVALTAAWERTLHSWTDAALHDTVLGLAAKHEQFAWLAARYREIAIVRPHDPVPAARLARLQRAALATLRFAPPPGVAPERKAYRGAAVLLIASVLAMVIGLRLVDMKSRDYQRGYHARGVGSGIGQVVSNAR